MAIPIKRLSISGLTAFVLAANYLAFQAEVFQDEYEENHPRATDTCTFTAPSLNWESFDKENAPQAFVFEAFVEIRCLFCLPADVPLSAPPRIFRYPVRDKSPPSPAQINADV